MRGSTLAGALAGVGWALWEGGGKEPAAVLAAAVWLHGILGAVVFRVVAGRIPGQRSRGAGLPALPAAGLLLAALAATAWLFRPPARALPPPGAPDILLVTCDTTRADRWAALCGAPWSAVAGPWTIFESAYAPVGLTAPAHASLLTGLSPAGHGLWNNGGVLRPLPSLPALLRAAGWRTLSADSVIHLDPGFGFGQGFDRVAGVEEGLSALLRPLQGHRLVRLLLRFLPAGPAARGGEATLVQAKRLWDEAAGPAPRFLWVHLFTPHWPYDPPGPEAEQAARAPAWPDVPLPGYQRLTVAWWRRHYDGELLEARRQIGDFLELLQATRRSGARPLWIVFTGDHGEALGEHGATDHGDLLYEEGLRVPLWVRVPGPPPGSPGGRDPRRPLRVAAPVTHLDLVPSLAELLARRAGIDLHPPADLPGRSWAPALSGEKLAPAPVFAATNHAAFRNAMVRDARYKLIHNLAATPEVFANRTDGRAAAPYPLLPPWMGEWETYDLSRDPAELHPLPDPWQIEGGRLRDLLGEWERRHPARPPSQGLSPDVVEALRELGYF